MTTPLLLAAAKEHSRAQIGEGVAFPNLAVPVAHVWRTRAFGVHQQSGVTIAQLTELCWTL